MNICYFSSRCKRGKEYSSTYLQIFLISFILFWLSCGSPDVVSSSTSSDSRSLSDNSITAPRGGFLRKLYNTTQAQMVELITFGCTSLLCRWLSLFILKKGTFTIHWTFFSGVYWWFSTKWKQPARMTISRKYQDISKQYIYTYIVTYIFRHKKMSATWKGETLRQKE